MSTANTNVADILRRYAAALSLEGADRFKIKAYRRAAETIEGLQEDVAELVRQGRDLTELSTEVLVRCYRARIAAEPESAPGSLEHVQHVPAAAENAEEAQPVATVAAK